MVGDRVDGEEADAGLEESLRAIERACERDGPFDGILGFSQGATLAAIALATPRMRERFGFGIFAVGMKCGRRGERRWATTR